MKFLGFYLFLTICISFSCEISFPSIYLKYLKKRALDIIDKAEPKDECSRHLKAWVRDLFNFKKLWALHMLDASAKPQTGLLTGNIVHWGNYDQCLKISEDKGNDGVIEGQYCTVVLSPVKNTSYEIVRVLDFVSFLPDVMGVKEGKELKHVFKIFSVLIGICLPKSCNADNFQKLWNYVEFTFRLPVHVGINANFCSHKGKVPHEFYFDKYVIWTFSLILFLVCLATVYDVMIYQKFKGIKHELCEKILISFSVHKNLKGIFHYPTANCNNSLSCLNGLKVLSMLWVIFGHRFAVGFISGNINLLDYFEFRKSMAALVVLLAPFAVDTFLTLSGLLLAYKYMEIRNILPSNRPIPYYMFYVLRCLRLWPALIATIFAYTTIIKYINSGPLWDMFMYKMSLTCANTGWLSALFMTNMVGFKHQCLEPSWYLAVDTQLYCIAPILLYLLYRYPKRATFALLTLSTLSYLYAYTVTVYMKIKWTPLEADEQYHMIIYQSTFVRMPSWNLGLLTGALLYNYQQIRIPKALVALLWIIIISIWLGLATVTNIMISTPYNEYSAGVYNALASSMWSLAVCSLIFLCATGYGGIINQILSFKIYSVIVKFSYSIFLLHMGIIMLISGNKRTATFVSSFTTLYGYFGDLPFIFAASVVWCLIFESPYINIAKIMIESKGGFLKSIAANQTQRIQETAWENNTAINHIPRNKKFRTKKNN